MPTTQGRSNDKSSPITARRVLVALLVLASLAFVVQNTNTVDIKWLMFGFSAPQLGVGFVVGWFVGRPNRKD